MVTSKRYLLSNVIILTRHDLVARVLEAVGGVERVVDLSVRLHHRRLHPNMQLLVGRVVAVGVSELHWVVACRSLLHGVRLARDGRRNDGVHELNAFLLLGLRDVVQLAHVAELDLIALLDQVLMELDGVRLVLDLHGSDSVAFHVENIKPTELAATLVHGLDALNRRVVTNAVDG